MTIATQTVPDQHSNLVGGSTAARRLACPRSYALEQLVPKDDGGSSYAQEGTVLHEMVAMVLQGKIDVEHAAPFTFTHKDGWTHTVDQTTWFELGVPALDAFDAFMDDIERQEDAEVEFKIEAKCEMPGIPGAFGTSDIIWRCGKVSGILDWKFGYGQVKAEENDQLRFYARAAMHAHPEFFKPLTVGGIAREVYLTIIQPQRSHEDDTWITDVDELEEWRLSLQEAIEEAKAATPKKGRIEKGGHCKFARCMAVCPLHVGATLDLGKRIAAVTAAGESPHAPSADFVSEIAAILELADAAGEWARQTMAISQRLIEESDEVRAAAHDAGWGLKAKRSAGDRYVEDENILRRRIASHKIPATEVNKKELISPAQLRKVFKKHGKDMPESWVEKKPSSGSTLVRIGDTPIDEYETPAQKVARLGKSLAGLV